MSAARQHTAALDPASLRAIEKGAHPAPFNVFGVQRSPEGHLLRVNAPGAWRVEARSRRDRSVLAVLDQCQTPGLFAAPFDGESPYVLRIYWPGHVEECEDPYSFPPTIPETNLRALRDGRVRGASNILGAHAANLDGVPGVRFAFWAPAAATVAVAGDFNEWSCARHPMQRRDGTGVWELFVPRIGTGARYCYAVREYGHDDAALVADPFARVLEAAPEAAAVVADPPRLAWRDERFLAIRRARRECALPPAIYRFEPEAWQAQEGSSATWRSLAQRLPPFVSALSFTHVQIAARSREGAATWMFAPPPELGAPEHFAAFVDACHEAGLGVIVEWDAPLAYASLDPSRWGAFRHNVLADSAMHWLETYHLDGLSFAAPHGAGEFLSRLRDEIEATAPGALLIVEDELEEASPYALTWRGEAMRATLDGQVHDSAAESIEEGSLLPVTPETLTPFAPDSGAADPLAALRAAYALAWLTPGAKLMHMGAELGQHEWRDGRVDWDLLDHPRSLGFLRLIRDLNNLLRSEAPIRLTTRVTQSMTWLPADPPVLAYLRSGEAAAPLLVAMNRAPGARAVRLDVPVGGLWRELLNTDSRHYGGGDVGNYGGAEAVANQAEAGLFHLQIILPPSGAIIFRHDS